MYYINKQNLQHISNWIDNNTHKFDKPIRNKCFIKKCKQLFNLICSLMDQNNKKTEIPISNFHRKIRAEYFSYKDCLQHLYNLKLIYYNTTKYGQPHHGHQFFYQKNYSKSFSGSYCIDHQLTDIIKNNDWNNLTIRSIPTQLNYKQNISLIKKQQLLTFRESITPLLSTIHNHIDILLSIKHIQDIFPQFIIQYGINDILIIKTSELLSKISDTFKSNFNTINILSLISNEYHIYNMHNMCPRIFNNEVSDQVLGMGIKRIKGCIDMQLMNCIINDRGGREYYNNQNYLKLELRGQRVCKGLPHYGKYRDGRYYSEFHTKSREQRLQIIWDNERIKQIYDISHCYPTLLVKLIQGKVKKRQVQDWKRLVFDNNRDVYIEILIYNKIQVTKANRDKIKPYVQKYINGLPRSIQSNLYNRGIRNNDPIYARAVYYYMKDNFPNIHKFIYNYSTSIQNVFDLKNFKIKQHIVKNICHDLQVIERQIIDKMTLQLKNKDNIQSVTLFDGIYIKQNQEVTINFDQILLKFFNYNIQNKSNNIKIDDLQKNEFQLYIKQITMNLEFKPKINPRI